MTPKFQVRQLSFFYGPAKVLHEVDLDIPAHQLLALIGPSGCGKSTFLRSLNRIGETLPGTRMEGVILLDGQNIQHLDPTILRRRVGMVFQRPNPFPKSIFENVAFGPRVNGFRVNLNEIVEQTLRQADLWDEVKDKLKAPAHALSGGQQQRLCIARALAVNPEVLLLDEPCSALDALSTARIEHLLTELAPRCTLVMVTHNMQQAARIAHRTGFFLNGRLLEEAPTADLFACPRHPEAAAYLQGHFG
jgi:phosphate transport system ATP-binding protein